MSVLDSSFESGTYFNVTFFNRGMFNSFPWNWSTKRCPNFCRKARGPWPQSSVPSRSLSTSPWRITRNTPRLGGVPFGNFRCYNKIDFERFNQHSFGELGKTNQFSKPCQWILSREGNWWNSISQWSMVPRAAVRGFRKFRCQTCGDQICHGTLYW